MQTSSATACPIGSLRETLRSAVAASPRAVRHRGAFHAEDDSARLFGSHSQTFRYGRRSERGRLGGIPDGRVERADPTSRTTAIPSGPQPSEGGDLSFRDPDQAL